MKIQRTTISLTLTAFWCFVPTLALAETLVPENVIDATAINNDLEKFSRLLDSDRFSERRLASQELSAAGVDALPVLEKVALGSSREASARAMTIIQQQYAVGDEATRSEAENFLKRIAESDNEFAARRAHESLSPVPQQTNPNNPFNPVFGGIQQQRAIQIQAAQLQQMRIQIAQQQAPARRIKVQIVNGEKTVTVTEGDRKVAITEKKDSIEVAVTEKKDGKDTTKTYKAKNADELKKNEPEGYGIYKKYNQGGVRLNAQIQGRIQLKP